MTWYVQKNGVCRFTYNSTGSLQSNMVAVHWFPGWGLVIHLRVNNKTTYYSTYFRPVALQILKARMWSREMLRKRKRRIKIKVASK